MNRKQLEIHLSQVVQPFKQPKIELEQYQTPPRVAANLLHIAWLKGDIQNKNVVDLCAGTGILGLGAALLGGEVVLVEKDQEAYDILLENKSKIDQKTQSVLNDVLTWQADMRFDTAILNPPFGIQQNKTSDMDFVKKAGQLAEKVYSIHDGSDRNQEGLPKLFNKCGLEIQETYLEEFPLSSSYPWHKLKYKIHNVLVVQASSL